MPHAHLDAPAQKKTRAPRAVTRVATPLASGCAFTAPRGGEFGDAHARQHRAEISSGRCASGRHAVEQGSAEPKRARDREPCADGRLPAAARRARTLIDTTANALQRLALIRHLSASGCMPLRCALTRALGQRTHDAVGAVATSTATKWPCSARRPTVRRGHQRIDRLLEVRVRHHDHVILARRGLYALARLGAAPVDVIARRVEPTNSPRAPAGDQQRVPAPLSPARREHPGRSGCASRRAMNSDADGSRSLGFSTKLLPQAMASETSSTAPCTGS